MKLKTLLKLGGLLAVLGLASLCFAFIFKKQIVDTLKIGVRITEFDIPRDIVLFDQSRIGEPLEVGGIVGMRAVKVMGSLVPRDEAYAPIEWADFEIIKGYPKRFRSEITLPGNQQLLYVESSIDARSRRMEIPILLRPALLFIVAGQSNASGKSSQVSVSPTDNVYYGELGEKGIHWRTAHDPGVVYNGGSVWPLVGHQLQKEHGVAIGFINVSVGATAIADWQPGGDYYGRLVDALKHTRSVGLTAVLWHQGESDHSTTTEAYKEGLEHIIERSRIEGGQPNIPWLISTATLREHEYGEQVRLAQQAILNPQKHLYPGPDTDSIGMEYREPVGEVHFNREGNLMAAELWLESIGFFLQLAE